MLPYGIIGNCKTCALIKKDTSVDWMCYPRFDSPSIFAKLLDKKKGGSLEIQPKGRYRKRQRYLPNTAILETTFTSRKGSFQVLDFFPRYRKLLKKRHRQLVRQNRLVRIIKPLTGKPVIKIAYKPKPGYAEKAPKRREEHGCLITKSNGHHIGCISNISYAHLDGKEEIALNSTKYLIIGQKDDAEEFSVKRCMILFHATKHYWERWVETLILPERNKERIIRSAITLKLLTYSKSGAILAAATTSIPEQLGTTRTFDYRFCWVRDATFATDALKKIGRGYESKKLMDFTIKHIIPHRSIKLLYGIDEKTELREREVTYLDGFKGTKPVRLGNAAHDQRQNDIYGELIDIIYLYFAYYQYEKRMTEKYWRFLHYLIGQIKLHWNEKDSSIWEFRGLKCHYTYSKLMCYVGIDRAIRVAQHYDKEALAQKWAPLRDAIRHDILTKGFDRKAKAFTMSYDSEALDAASLLMTYHEFLEPTDPRIVSTVKAIYNNLRKGALVQRYRIKDDFGVSKSAFTSCSFWLVDALHYIGEEKKAWKLYERLCTYSNHLGLFSEDIDLATGKLIGNFPQAYTHISLINSSLLLSEWSAKRVRIDWSAIPKKGSWW